MKPKLIILLLFVNIQSFAQTIQNDVISTAGESNSTSKTKISWTIGEPIIETESNGNSIVTQGFQQSYFTVTSIEYPLIDPNDIELSVYPNPTAQYLKIDYKLGNDDVLHFQIISMNGKQLSRGDLIKNEILKLDLSEFFNATYFINVYSIQNQLFRSYKIQKVN